MCYVSPKPDHNKKGETLSRDTKGASSGTVVKDRLVMFTSANDGESGAWWGEGGTHMHSPLVHVSWFYRLNVAALYGQGNPH